ncbi:MAG: hypothetical protein IT347_09635 [Candidatus Eisenbacteria bacterium]|nr:hypothetical protein [Candidatus Eisenbacteria bacterium]
MGADFVIRGTVRGTPRTYGDRRTEDAWRRQVVAGRWSGHEDATLPIRRSIELQFTFRINAGSKDYGGASFPNGRDLDTLVVQSSTSAALLVGRNSVRPSLRWVDGPLLVRRVLASKVLVETDADAGVEITLRPATEQPSIHPYQCALEFQVLEAEVRNDGLAKAIKRTVGAANRAGVRFPATARIGLSLLFSDAERPRNILSEALLEKTIDALGASPVGDRRLFDETPGSRTILRDNTDDSIIFKLYAEKSRALDTGVFIQGRMWRIAD